ncbi:MAG TPA: methylated-DNA--[protein]-cysteine S-methyltransferase [Candidatus Limnocylindrales bacterium]|nr:methylated-DNA--[protein]-cysteine S-methyltransferase [Candidatus Limnocylindrales bacterium]
MPGQLIAVTTTDIFCRAGCPARSPRPDHVQHFETARQALFAGFRPCLRCRPLDEHRGDLSDAQLRRVLELHPLLASARRARRVRSGATAIVIRMLATPLGPMLAGTTDDGICLLEFTDRRMLPTQLDVLRRRLGRPLVTGSHPHLDALSARLDRYFAGSSAVLDLPLVAPGTPFQQGVWEVLRAIPAGETISYQELAERAGVPGAQRAAGTANGANRLALLIPCHRVVRKSGETGNYGGGRWRKDWLLRHEAALAARARTRTAALRSPVAEPAPAPSPWA